jgi:hypothetical protein
MCVSIFSTTYIWNLFLSWQIKQDITNTSSRKCLIFLSECNQTWIFCTNFIKNPQYKFSEKSVQRKTSCKDRYDETNSRFFLNITDAPKNQYPFREANPGHLAPYLISILTYGFLMTINNAVKSRKVTDAHSQWSIRNCQLI